jgi:uncharacterized protein (TIGR02246 family)
MKRSLLAFLAITFAAALQAQEMDVVRRLDEELAVATWTGDALWFQDNLADDYVLVTPGGTVRTKREVIGELATPGLKMDPFEATEVRVRVYGDAAVVTGRMLQRFTLGGIRYANDVRYTNVYVRRKSRWLLASGHATSVAVRR